jgi:hypothetical protein
MEIREFAQALQSKDPTRYGEWFADDIRLYTPIHEEPAVGKRGRCSDSQGRFLSL